MKTPRPRDVQAMNPDAPLSDRHQLFCREYVAGLAKGRNATDAYRKAYPNAKGASVDADAAKLLKQPRIRAEVKRLMAPKMKKLDITADRTLNAIAQIGFCDPRKAFAEDGTLLPIHQMPDEIAFALASFDIEDMGDGVRVSRVKFWDKGQAQERLAKILKMFQPEQVEHQHRVSFVIEGLDAAG